MDDDTLLHGGDLEGEALPDWRILFSTLTARFTTGDFATGLRLVQQIGEAAEEADHHPDLDLSYPRVDVRLTSHDVGGVTARDVRMARRISQLAADLGATAEPTTPDRHSGRVKRVNTPDVRLTDQAGAPWDLADHRDAAALLIFLRGDW